MFNHNIIEKFWQTKWQKNNVHKFTDDKKKKKFYVLDMFPYPSGAGLHVGHLKGYVATDVIARYKKLNNFCVLHPIGWDAFGLPAEQYAIATNKHPKAFTAKNINNFRKQIKSVGLLFDFNKEVNTTDPKYYKWTQWIFTKLFEKGLAEIRNIDVNWCEQLHTVLSNEEVVVENDRMLSERGHFPVIKKPMQQWVLKITNYADKLLEGLDTVDWPESLKSIQRQWIGKSSGACINFNTSINKTISVYTTRPDTIFGSTFISIAPEHDLALALTTEQNKKEVQTYIAQAKAKPSLLRTSLQKDKTGVFTGSYAINPINGKQLPIYIADYILKDYGTGAIMGVPGHDQRDFDFAKKYNIPIIFIIECQNHNEAYVGDGNHINSEFINGLNIAEANKKIMTFLKTKNIGEERNGYKLKDWIFSRQRYWGEPFPIIYDKNNKPQIVTKLPLLLPNCKDFKPSADNVAPLAKIKSWVNFTNHKQVYHHDINTMPQWAGSCWYYIGYILKKIDGNYVDLTKAKAALKRWLPVDLYVGGQEHAVLHLLYARFWHRFLYDIGVVPTKEPFNLVVNQGMVLDQKGHKMSKSEGNVVSPDEIISVYGADALRLYELFMGPITASLPWQETGLAGMRKWLEKVYKLFTDGGKKITKNINEIDNDLNVAYNVFVKSCQFCIENKHLNVAISKMMIYINHCYDSKTLYVEHLKNFIIILSCFAPHIAEEIWHKVLHQKTFVSQQTFPHYDEKLLETKNITIPVQVLGRLRSTIQVSVNASEQEIKDIALNNDKIKQFINGKPIKKFIYVKHKIINIIV